MKERHILNVHVIAFHKGFMLLKYNTNHVITYSFVRLSCKFRLTRWQCRKCVKGGNGGGGCGGGRGCGGGTWNG